MRAVAACVLVCLVSAAAAGADFQRHPLEFRHEDVGTPELEELRERYDFDEYVATGATELERMILLQDWVYRHVTYGGATKYVDLRNSLTILSKAAQGEVFWCNNIAAVYMQCAASLGWTSRYVFLRSPLGDAHVSNDIWSNELRKWIMVDATWNLHIERDGEVLSIPEVRDAWNRKDGADLVYVFGAGGWETHYTEADMPIERPESKLWHWWPVDQTWISFTHAVAYVMRNDFFAMERDGDSVWSDIVTIRDQHNRDDPYWEFRNRPGADDLRELYHDVNRVDVRLVPSYVSEVPRPSRGTSPGAVTVWLDAFGPNNYTPNLDYFLVQLNDGEWMRSGASLLIRPRAGINRIRAKAVNKFGVQGPITTCDIAVAADAEPRVQTPLPAWEAEGEELLSR